MRADRVGADQGTGRVGEEKAKQPPLPQEEEGKEEEFEERLRATELSPSEGREKEEPDPAISGPSNLGIRLLLGRLKETVKAIY